MIICIATTRRLRAPFRWVQRLAQLPVAALWQAVAGTAAACAAGMVIIGAMMASGAASSRSS